MSSSSFITLAVTRLATQSVHNTAIASHNPSLFLPAGRAGPKITLRFLHQPTMAARRALEWIRTSKARLVFRYEISDLFCHLFIPVHFPPPTIVSCK